nr:hypothetical protein [Tanacetum cinerariifolium]
MNTTIDQQVAMDEALIPHAKRLRIGRSNFCLLWDIKSKESTLQLVYNVMRLTSFFKGFWSPQILPHQPFVEPPFEEAILAFLHFLRHSRAIRKLTDVNINKLHQPWRSFAAIINKCLTGKNLGYDSLRLSQAQILWGLYHKRNDDFAYLRWKDFIYQVEHKDTKKSNEMYYLRFTKHKPMEFQVGDKVMLKVSPWKGVIRFSKRGKLNPRVHNMFHVSNLRKCHADEPLAVPLDGLHFDDKLHFVEKPVEIVNRKVRWNSKRGPEFTWEREDQFQKKYPQLFARTTSTSSVAS